MRVNQQIRVPQVRLIGSDGKQVGLVDIDKALQMAREEGLDLVEVVAKSDPPVCKLVDFGKFRYDQTKKKKEGKKLLHQIKVKEIKFKPNIDTHDLEFKIKKAEEFLQKGDKVRISCVFKGRELLHKEIGEEVFKKFCDALTEFGAIESPAKLLGKTLAVVMAPVLPPQKKAN